MASSPLTHCPQCRALMNRMWAACAVCGGAITQAPSVGVAGSLGTPIFNTKEPTPGIDKADKRVSEEAPHGRDPGRGVSPLSPTYPCVVCDGKDRWDDHGIWRCRACWPPVARTSRAADPGPAGVSHA